MLLDAGCMTLIAFLGLLLSCPISICAETSSVQTSPKSISSASRVSTSCLTKLPTPLSIPIRNVTLGDGTLRRGAALSFGTPPQPLALGVNARENNTLIYDGSAPCNDDDSRPQCTARYGGLFDGGSSSTFTNYNNLTAPGFAGGLPHWYISGTDSLKVSNALDLDDFPIGISRVTGGFDHSQNINVLGLGSNSSLLTALSNSSNIPSRSFGYWSGMNGAEAKYQMDGNVVLGGYDQAKIDGPNVTIPINNIDLCLSGFVISITDIQMNLRNGSNPSILGEQRGSSIRACVAPNVDYLSVGYDIWSAFVNVSGVEETSRTTGPFHYYTMNVAASSAYDGDMTVTVYPNLKIRIPNHQLVIPDYDVDSQGNTVEKNSSNRNVLLYSLQDINKNDMPLFGGPFLSAAYFFVNYDQNEFSLWQSKATTNTDLVPVGPPTCKPDAPKNTPQSTSALGSTPPSASPTNAEEPRKTNMTAAVAGGVVGGLAAIACASLALLLYRRRKHKKEQNAPILDSKDSMYKQPPEYLYSKAEMPTDRLPPQEMPLEQNPPYNLAPHEMMTKPNNRGTLHELPTFKAQYSLPPTPKRPRRTRSTDGNFDIGSV